MTDNFPGPRGAARAAVLAVAAAGMLAFASQASATITPTPDGSTLGGAMNASGGPVGSGSLAAPATTTPNAVSTTALTGFPETGSTNYGVLTTGDPLLIDQANTAERQWNQPRRLGIAG